MGRYGKYDRMMPSMERPYKVHPIWRGIGCLMIFMIPIMAYAGATLLVKMNLEQGWVPFPSIFRQTVVVPVINLPAPFLYGNLMVAAVLTVIGFGILMILYTLLYQAVGPSRYGPLDAPPERRKVKKSR